MAIRRAGKFTLSYSVNDTKLEIKRKTVPENIKYWAETKPDVESFVFLNSDLGREAITWKGLYDSCLQFGQAFVALGVKPGDIVAITLPVCPTWLYVALGATFAGATPLGVTFIYKDGSDVTALIRKLQDCTTFVLDPQDNNNCWGIFKSLLSSYSFDGTVSSTCMPSLKYLLCTDMPKDGISVLTIESFLRLTEIDCSSLPDVKPEDLAVLFQTSGSTGIPKAVAHSHFSFTGLSRNFAPLYLRGENNRFYNDFPFNWIGGYPLNTVNGETRICVSGGAASITDRGQFIIAAVKQERCSTMIALPPLLRQLIDKRDTIGYDWPINTIVTGGQPISRRFSEVLGYMCNTFVVDYGSTEIGIIAGNIVQRGDDFIENSCGVPLKEAEIKVVDNNGDTVPINTTGELYIRWPYHFKGYYKDPDKTRATMTEDGWYKSDDVGRMDENGHFFVEGRKSDVILSGGLNVIPSLLETILEDCPGIKAAVVVPIPDDTMFQLLCACLIQVNGSDITCTEARVRKYCEEIHNDKLGVLTVLPTYYIFFEKFPETSTGKISRKNIASEAIKRIGKLCSY